MISIPEMELNIVRAYIERIETEHPIPTYESKKLLLVLRIYQSCLILRRKPQVADDFDWLMTLKHGVRQAEILLVMILENQPALMAGWYMGRKPKNEAQELANLLSSLSLELTKDISGIEACFPELKFAFDRERKRYREMKNAADEALKLE